MRAHAINELRREGKVKPMNENKNKKFIFNSKLQLLYNNMERVAKKEISFNMDNLRELFFPPFKKVYDCIIISNETVDMLERKFNKSLEFFGGKNLFEISETEILINSYTYPKRYDIYTLLKLALLTIECWQSKLKTLDVNAKICFYISIDEKRLTLRFHKLRVEEENWLEDVDDYGEPVGYIIY